MSQGNERQPHPDNAPGDWFVDRACIDCGASCSMAPGIIVGRDEQSVFARQPAGAAEEQQVFRAMLVCPTSSVRSHSRKTPPDGLMPEQLEAGLYRCGYNARSSYGAHSYFVTRKDGNLLVDSPRFLDCLATFFERAGGLSDILLTHQDDVADAGRYAQRFAARVWIHEADQAAAPFATDRLTGREPTEIRPGLEAIPVPGHTRGSVVYRLDGRILFTGDSLAWSFATNDLEAFRDACWYSWSEQADSLERLLAYPFSRVLAGHGGSIQRDDLMPRLQALVKRMRSA